MSKIYSELRVESTPYSSWHSHLESIAFLVETILSSCLSNRLILTNFLDVIRMVYLSLKNNHQIKEGKYSINGISNRRNGVFDYEEVGVELQIIWKLFFRRKKKCSSHTRKSKTKLLSVTKEFKFWTRGYWQFWFIWSYLDVM